MADLPKYEDKVIAGPGGVILYSYSNGETWNWDNKPVRLSEGDYLPATGNFSNNSKLGLMYEVYIWRVEGSSKVYRTKEEARKGVGLIVNLSKIVREQKWVIASQVRVDFNVTNQNNTPDPGSPVTQDKTEQEKIEEELKSQVYDRNPNQIKHSVLVKNAEGKWMLIFPNGYTIEYSAFMKLTTLERQNAAALDTKTGLVTNPTGTKTGDDSPATFPTWAYAVVGALVVAIMGLFMLSKPKSSKK